MNSKFWSRKVCSSTCASGSRVPTYDMDLDPLFLSKFSSPRTRNMATSETRDADAKHKMNKFPYTGPAAQLWLLPTTHIPQNNQNSFVQPHTHTHSYTPALCFVHNKDLQKNNSVCGLIRPNTTHSPPERSSTCAHTATAIAWPSADHIDFCMNACIWFAWSQHSLFPANNNNITFGVDGRYVASARREELNVLHFGGGDRWQADTNRQTESS